MLKLTLLLAAALHLCPRALALQLCGKSLVSSAKAGNILAAEALLQRARGQQTRAAKRRQQVVRRRISRLQHIDRERLLEQVRPALEDPENAIYAQDYLNYLRIRALGKKGVVALLAGNLQNDSSPAVQDLLERVLSKYVRSGALVLYDADSRLADWIAQRLGKQGVAISARPRTDAVVITDPHLRLQAFLETEMRVFTPDSPAGLAVALRTGRRHVIDPDRQWSETLALWPDLLRTVEQRDLNLGALDAAPIAGPLQVTEIDVGSTKRKLRKLRWESLGYNDIADAWVYVTESRAIDAAIGLGGGAAIFGSASYDGPALEQEYRTAYALARLGIAVATGGSGGAMHVTNAGAFDAGGESIGVPIAGQHSLSHEKVAFTDVHTITYPTSNYHTRLRALLRMRAMILLQPGGGGTLRELAVVLMNESAERDPALLIGLIERTYYQDLYNFIRSLPLPETLLAKVQLLDGTAEVEGAVQQTLLDHPELMSEAVGKRSRPPRETRRDPSGLAPASKTK